MGTATRPPEANRRSRNAMSMSLIVEGYKSLKARHEVEIAPLTILAGANSSGKSSLLQPLLLLKQTLEASYDPGPLKLDGPHVRFSEATQLFWRGKTDEPLRVGMKLGKVLNEVEFAVNKPNRKDFIPLRINKMNIGDSKHKIEITEGPLDKSLGEQLRELSFLPSPLSHLGVEFAEQFNLRVQRNRCFLNVYVEATATNLGSFAHPSVINALRQIIHVPGLRGNPERTYEVTAVGTTFPGIFEAYTASLVADWERNNPAKLTALTNDLKQVGLTWKVSARRIDDTKVELRVGRMPASQKGGAHDLVSIADVGFGVSQVLPVLVALQVAQQDQIVYIEQPEIHLHPKAQASMAQLLVNAAKRGVRVVIETHSSLLLTSIQTLVASGEIDFDKVRLHWFSRNEKTGESQIATAQLSTSGALGDWPQDFAEVEMDTQFAYIKAASNHPETNLEEQVSEDN